MRRTYRSKKDTANVIERRDLFQNLDGKSTAYDAFSMQNIKQTKRELSCIASSNPVGVASSRVRKKKYVKRIVKEAETPCRESISSSAYLTPDKSIHVNKPLDPFDLLLISSPANSVETARATAESVSSKVELFDQLVPKKEGRTYTRQKPKKAKKFNISSTESSDSDKENSDDRPNITQNTSDIRTHKLLVEPEVDTTPKNVNDSINNIVNNISLLNRLKNKYNADNSINKSFKLNRHRLTRNIQSPLLQKSPLCSTPFKVKYRGESIFKFSPIAATNADNSPKYMTIMEDNNGSNCSIVFVDKDIPDSPKDIEEKVHSCPTNTVPVDDNDCRKIADPEKETDDIEKDTDIVNTEKSDEVKELSIFSSNSIVNPSVEKSLLQTTECEPFLGFSQNPNTEDIAQSEYQMIRPLNLCDSVHALDSVEIEAIESESYSKEKSNDTIPENDITQLESIQHSQDNYSNENTAVSNEEDDDHSSIQSTDNDKDSLYDTCNSEQSSIQDKEIIKKPVVLLQRMNDSSFFRYFDKMSDNTESDENEGSLQSEFASFSDSGDSDQSSESGSHIESDVEKDVSEIEEDKSYYDEEAEFEEDDKGSSSNTEEEKCISFVTTRRRNEVTNNSMMSMFNDSYCSSSTDCDKTVLNNNKECEKAEIENNIDNNDTLMDLEIYDKDCVEDIDLNKDSEHSDDPSEGNETRISFVTTRNSNVTDRKSSILARKSNIKPKNSILPSQNSTLPSESIIHSPESSRISCLDTKPAIVLQPGKKWERSLSIYRRMTMMTDHFDESILEEEATETKGRKYRQSVISTMEMQEFNSSLHNESINSRRSTFVSKPSRSTIRIVKDPNRSSLSLCNTTVYDGLKGRNVQKKWANLRTCFRRELNAQKNTKSGQAANKRRKYVYFEQLLFLLPCMENRLTEGNLEEDNSLSNDEDDDQAGSSTPTPIRQRKKRPNVPKQTDMDEALLKALNEPNTDEDVNFALSLVPSLQNLTAEEKLDAKISILNVFKQIRLARCVQSTSKCTKSTPTCTYNRVQQPLYSFPISQPTTIQNISSPGNSNDTAQSYYSNFSDESQIYDL